MISEKTKTYTVERLGVHNIEDLSRLFTAVYERERPAGFFMKKYDTGYTGSKYVGFIAYNQHHLPISYYGVIPTFIWYDGQVILAAQSVDTMTHPQYRNAGLFIELAKNTYELCKNEGIRIIFGFPNQNSLPGFLNKLKWHTTENMYRFTIPVTKTIPLEKLAHTYPALKPIYTGYKKWVLNDYLNLQQGVANSVLADNYNGVFRDAKYLRYKAYSPTQVIQLGRSTIWLKLQTGMQVGDITGTDNFDKTINKLISLARKLGIEKIHFHVSPQTELYKLFSQYYTPNVSFPVIFKDLGEGIASNKIKFTFADIDIF